MATLLMVIVFISTSTNSASACTNFLITKGASADGSTMISYAADSHVLYGELYFRQAKDYPEGTMMDIYEWDTGKYLGQIPQAKHTYSVVGNMNEHQVAIGETTYGGRKELRDTTGLVDYGSLMYITLQRSKSAREAIKVMTELVDKYGYYSSGESFSIADKNEVWILEMISKGMKEKGAVWVARMIPDGYVAAHANQARITTFPKQKENNWFDKEQTTFHSEDVIDFARDMGYYDGKDKNFSFSDTYAPVSFGGARFCEIRVWSFFKDINDNMQKHFDYAKGDIEYDDQDYATNRMPLWIKPNKKISVHDVMNFMRDHLEGTELDMRKDAGAGPYERPYRWRPLTWKVDSKTYFNERATGTQQTGFSFVTQSRNWLPDAIGGINWFSVDDAASTVYTPIYCGVNDVPEKFEEGYGSLMEFKDDAAFWVFNQVSNLAYLFYNRIHPEIHTKQQALENKYINYRSAIDKAAANLYKKDKALAIQFLTDYSSNTANALVAEWKDFYEYLFTKYMDGNIKRPNPGKQNPHLKQPGYSEDFYKIILEDTGDRFEYHGSH
ncbi:MAG: C69 family dipeptidase [Bacteroidales bacterium]|nr:C69 family dipeptidase [Bacteroidales bacterium]